MRRANRQSFGRILNNVVYPHARAFREAKTPARFRARPATNEKRERATAHGEYVVYQIRIHGRGGQGVVTAAEMLSVAAFTEGHWAQAFPSFGSERTGAPVVAFARIDEKDAALERRFQPITVEEPSREEAVAILKGLCPYYEEHHGVKIEEKALEAAVDMSVRYINDRFLPDKAIDLIDEASSKLRLTVYTEPEEIKKPMDVKVNIQAEAGIESFIIKINSPILATILQQLGATDVVENTVTLDLIDGTDGAVTMVKGLLLPEGLTDLRGYSELLPLDLSGLVPLILDLGGADPNSIVGNHIFTLSMTDTQNSSITRTLTFYVPAPPTITYAAGAWNDMATFTLQNIPADAQTVKVQYKTTDESQWHDAEVNSDRTAAIVRPEFTSHTSADWTTLEAANVKPYKRKVAGTGILDGKTYQYKLIVDSFESEVAEFDSAAADRTNPAIPALDQKELSCYTTENNTDATWWGSGNNTFAKSLCKHDATYKGAHLKAESGGLVAFVGLAPGNLFSGKFYRPSTDGTVYFGQPYQWAKRPSGVKVQYDAKTGNVNNGKHGWKIAEGSPDYARIFVAIVNWEKTRDVTSGMSTPKGCWDPETSSDPSGDNCGGGQIVAYASLWISQTALKGSFNEVTLPFNWYAEDVNPANANYSLVISCSTSAYGDYLNGYKSAEMYVGDFEWVY